MDSAAKIKPLLLQIVKDNFPEEEAIFNEFADNYIAMMDAGDDPREINDNNAYNEFGERIGQQISKSISMLIATVSTILDYNKNDKSKIVDQMGKMWQKELRLSGMDEETATMITKKYGEDIKKYLL